MITCWLMHWQTSYLAGSQKAAEMARCLLVIQHNGRVCEHTCVCVCVWYVWVAACVYLWLNLLLRSGGFFVLFACFPASFCILVRFLFDSCAPLVSWMPVIICSRSNFSFQIKTQLAQLSLNSTEEVCFSVFWVFVCMPLLYLCVCLCMPMGNGNQRSRVV